MIQLSNPRSYASIENWPHGQDRVTAIFEVESKKLEHRVSRITTGKPKKTTYYHKIAIVDGDDGHTYVIAATKYDQMVLMPGTLKFKSYFYLREHPQEYQQIKNLLGM